jgi:hypothetical protein
VDVVAFASHGEESNAVKRDGSVLSWGYNSYGQLGDGTLSDRSSPVVVLRENGAGSVATNDWYLDLDPAVATTIPPDKIPAFLLVASGSAAGDTANVTADVRFRAQDVGSTGSVYVFALAPAGIVRNSSFAAQEKDTVQCVLAQLNASGQLQAVSVSSLQAYVTGVLSGQGQAVTVLNGVPVAQIAGATFFVGYGPSANAMVGQGTNRGVATVSGAATCAPQKPQTGWWWNPAESGRGYSIEASGSKLFWAAYLYDVSGRATWTIAAGNTSLDGSLFVGRLESYSGGQTLSGAYRAPTSVRDLGEITLAFSDASHGTMIWPGGTVAIERFNIIPNGLTAAPRTNQPESGWWWNPAESGRGYFIEWQGDTPFIAGYMYDDAGDPIWYASSAASAANIRSYSGNWLQFGNGQTMTGTYRAPTQVNSSVAPVTIQFSGPDTGLMTLPGGRTSAIQRYRF